MILIKTIKLLKNSRVSKLNFIITQVKALMYSKIIQISDKTYTKQQKKVYNQKKIFKQNLINYIIKINSTKTNTFLNITDNRGNLKLSFSSGLLGLKKRQKVMQPNAYIQLLKKVFLNAKFLKNKTVSLQFKNIKPFHELFILKMLKDKIFVKTLRSYNLYPHNGCRPKKIKRFKRRTKRLSL